MGLKEYITQAREKKLSDEQITNSLLAAGWPAEQIMAALARNADLPVPPPPPSVAHVGMWTGFLYILFFISLYVLATAIGGIFNTWVDKALPSPNDSLTNYYFDNSTVIQGYIAAVIVSYPLFIVLAFMLKKQLTKQPLVKNLRSRKLLIYITLIGTFLIMLGEVIGTIYAFLSGSVTSNVMGHFFVIVLIAGSIFAYFIAEVIHDRKTV